MSNLNADQFGDLSDDEHARNIRNLRGNDASYQVGDSTITPMRNPNGTLKKLTAYQGGPHLETAYSVIHSSGRYEGTPAAGAANAVSDARRQARMHERHLKREQKDQG